jgi:hypothetical protein
MKKPRIFLSLTAVFWLAAPLQGADQKCRITLSEADLKQMNQILAGGQPQQWDSEFGHAVRCQTQSCRVSCDAPPNPQTLQRWDNFRTLNIKNYLGLIQKARQLGHPQKDTLAIAECDSQSCTLVHD